MINAGLLTTEERDEWVDEWMSVPQEESDDMTRFIQKAFSIPERDQLSEIPVEEN